ncbi:outer membrane beta-barrel family protein [Daejeonella lutea]|uniref:Carboxypeptidase regulatory-like domain-containing protein n=1 Tax=Daejeonella lutea TaxID=572036 RepID=A0A1T5EBY0_9SPHI|nr:outer membrane beta-barrel family protein [Daejeonella lutea]SKB81366.1 Carboxypeptidase regulatory-like domain-containing protein [Daejeonella lutea]
MRTSFLAAILVCLSTAFSYGQNPFSVKGSVRDTISNVSLVNSTIVVLNSKDSTLVKYTRADGDGNFSLNNLKEGNFILMVSYPDYADYTERFSLNAAKPTANFGRIRMMLTARLLQEVIVKGTVAEMVIKGDTTEFNAAAFKTEANAKVEDLLKQIPGMSIDKDGKITAQGQTVNKVLVDGEEFFGDDPTLVTKNIRADMVDKVQVYDKKSDQATFTGIDDGERTKTVNIKLKENSKSGYFGKVEAGGGNDEFYDGQAMFNVFKGKKKFSAYGTIANTAKTGLAWNDNSKYGGQNLTYSDEGYFYISSSGDSELDSYDGRYNGEGIPETRSGGVHYDTKWATDKHSINLNYKIGSINVGGINNSLNQNNLPTGIINSNSNRNFDNYMFRHKLDATYLVKVDSTSELKISVDGTLKQSNTETNFLSNSARGNGIALNSSTRSLTNESDQSAFNATALWNKKLKKKGRSLSLNLVQRINKDDANGFLNSKNSFFNSTGTLDSIQNINQLKTDISTSSLSNANLAYTEPLSKTFSVVVNYGLGLTKNNSDRKSFNQSASGEYNILDNQFSNNFDLEQINSQVGAIFNYRKGKTVINFGNRTNFVDFNQTDLDRQVKYERSFTNWQPQASYSYNFSTQKTFSVRYNGNSTQPTLNQIQPVRVNTDPLNITLGNTNLDPSFRSSVSANYYSYKVIADRAIQGYLSYSFTSNAIVNNTVTDAAGKSTYQSINLSGKTPQSVYFYGSYGLKIPTTEYRISLGTDLNSSTYYNMINNELNKTASNNYGVSINFSKYVVKKHSFNLTFNPAYNTNQASLQKQMNNNGWIYNVRFNANVTLPHKIVIGVNGTYLYQQKTQSFAEDFDRLLVSTTLTKSFFKAENLKFQLSGNDLFNQNVGFTRRATNNMIVQNSYTTIKRYGMFSVIYDLSKMGGPTAAAPKP